MSSKPRFVGEEMKLGELLLNTFSGEWGTEEGELLTPVLRTSNFNEDGSLNYSTPAMRCIPEGKVAKKRMVRGDIILEKSGGTPKRPVGIMAFYDSDALALCSNFNQVLRFDESRILPRFAFHQLRWLKDRNAFDRYTRKTTGLQNLQMKKLIELKLRVPQIEAQTSIATTLDEIVCDQRALQQEIACLDSLVKSRFVEMLDACDLDTVNRLDSCTKRVKVGFVGTVGKYYTDDSGVPMVRTTNITSMGLDLTDLRFVTEEFDRNNTKSHLRSGDVIIARHGENGRACAYWGPEAQCLNVVMIEPDESKLLPTCLEHLMNSDLAREQIASMLVGSTQKVVNTKTIASILVPAIPLDLQHRFAAFVSQVDKSRFIAQQQIEKLQMLYDSLAQDYFGD